MQNYKHTHTQRDTQSTMKRHEIARKKHKKHPGKITNTDHECKQNNDKQAQTSQNVRRN